MIAYGSSLCCERFLGHKLLQYLQINNERIDIFISSLSWLSVREFVIRHNNLCYMITKDEKTIAKI